MTLPDGELGAELPVREITADDMRQPVSWSITADGEFVDHNPNARRFNAAEQVIAEKANRRLYGLSDHWWIRMFQTERDPVLFPGEDLAQAFAYIYNDLVREHHAKKR